MKFHSFLREHAALPAAKKGLVPIAWIITLGNLSFPLAVLTGLVK